MKVILFIMLKPLKIYLAAALLSTVAISASAQNENIQRAIELYENGLYSDAKFIFDNEESLVPLGEAYSTLCELRLRTPDCKEKYLYFKNFNIVCNVTPLLDYYYATILYDEGHYRDCLKVLEGIKIGTLEKELVENYYFYCAQCLYEIKEFDKALDAFIRIWESEKYTAYKTNAAYSLGFMYYKKEDFETSSRYFEAIVDDPQFADVAAYYILENRFMLKDYMYVVQNGPALFVKVPQERQPRLARIISESYMLTGNLQAANEYFLKTDSASIDSDNDFYYAGSILYALKDFKGAAANFSKIEQKGTLLSQQAEYNLAYSYVSLKNKTAALPHFKAAADMDFDAKIKKDAFINYAKLSFDLNKDGSAFKEYVKRYPEESENEKIYSYMAISSLTNGNYDAAIDSYDLIESLDADQELNYVKANYLRGRQLYDAKNYTACIPYLKLASHFAEEGTELKKRSQYLLADATFLAEKYPEAQELYTELFNRQSLYGLAEGNILTYDVAYCYLSVQDYAGAEKWFKQFVSKAPKNQVSRQKDAAVRLADCQFVQTHYADAAASYLAYNAMVPADLYSLYQAGLCWGLVNKNKEKISALAKAYNAKPESPYYDDCLFELGRAYETVKNTSDALKTYNHLASTSTSRNTVAKSLLQAALLLRGKKENNSAISAYKRVIEEYANTEYYNSAVKGLESLYLSMNRPKEYFDYIESLGKIQEQKIEDKEKAIYDACFSLYQANNFAGALEAFGGFIESHKTVDTLSVASRYYSAICLTNLGKNEKAAAMYREVLDSEIPFEKARSAEAYATLSYGLQNYEDALYGYVALKEADPASQQALLGECSCLYNLERYEEAIPSLQDLVSGELSAEILREARYMLAKSYLATSQRDKAKDVFAVLAVDVKSRQGAEAAVFMIEDLYFSGEFEAVENAVFDLADKGCSSSYYLAKAYIILGDSYAELGRLREAKATFESIKNGYKGTDEISSEVEMRLAKLQ